jgi:hypothetical protein
MYGRSSLNCLWWQCLLTDRDEMSNLHRGHSIDVSCHVSVNLAKRFQRRRFKQIGQSETRWIITKCALFRKDPKAMWVFGITWCPSFVVCHLLTFHILIFSSETHQPNELNLSRKHLWKVLSKECTFCYDPLPRGSQFTAQHMKNRLQFDE